MTWEADSAAAVLPLTCLCCGRRRMRPARTAISVRKVRDWLERSAPIRPATDTCLTCQKFLSETKESLHQCLRDIDVFVHRVQLVLDVKPPSKNKKLAFKRSRSRRGGSSIHDSRNSEIVCYMPTELDMSGILKRIKLAINYVARLRYHLYQPNAPELVHVLFTHLATLVSVCRTGLLYNSSLPSRVILPLLSRDAVHFLRLSLISTETDLWKSLGSAWTTPRDEWKGEDSLCNAVLLEGWEACYPPNGTVVHRRPYSRRRQRSGTTTDTETFLSEDTRSLSTPRSRFS